MMFDDAIRKLRDLQRKTDQLDGQHEVPLAELFCDEFMLRNTDFPSIGAMLEASGFNVDTTADFAAIPDDEWDAVVRAGTRFTSWDDMKRAAGGEWARRRLELQ